MNDTVKHPAGDVARQSAPEGAPPAPVTNDRPPDRPDAAAFGGVVWVTPAHPQGVFRES